MTLNLINGDTGPENEMKKTMPLFLAVLLAGLAVQVRAQDVPAEPSWMQAHINNGSYAWTFPYRMDHADHFSYSADGSVLQMHRVDNPDITVPFGISQSSPYSAQVDSLTFTPEMTEWGRDKYRVFAIRINTVDDAGVESKEEYVPCYISIDGLGQYPDNAVTGRIRGRGNSTWLWYDKKPYRLKFDASAKMLGIKKNKDWVLLANYRDVSKMMNTFCSLTAEWMGLPYTTPVRYAEVFLNDEYMGVYQVAEQVEVGGNRVAIDEAEGVLLSLDVDDGPGESPNAGDNFWSEVYNMPVCVKSPKDPTAEQLAKIKSDFAVLERAIKGHNYANVDTLLDLPSYIAMIQLQEFVFNVELSAPRSVYLFRDKGGKYTLGPAWDWDAGFAFSWADMTTGHTYFTDYNRSLLGRDPFNRDGEYKVPHFFTDMFGNDQFMREYKARWAEISDSILTINWAETQKFVDGLNEAQTYRNASGRAVATTPMQRDEAQWTVRGFKHADEVQKLKTWLEHRLAWVNERVASFPETGSQTEGTDVDNYDNVATLTREVTLQYATGYTQDVQISVTRDELASALGASAADLNTSTLSLVPLNTDGSAGDNTAAKAYGAWFGSTGNPVAYNNDQRVFIESNDLYTWNCGLEQSNVADGETYTVRMQYRYAKQGMTRGKAVTVAVTFTISGSSSGSWDDWWNW